MAELILQNDVLRVSFDSATGQLLCLQNLKTGWKVQDGPGLSFGMLIPLEDKHNNKSRADLPCAAVQADDSRITFTWERIPTEFIGALDITFVAQVKLDGDKLLFSGTVHNRSPHTVEVVAYPCFGDIRPSAEGKLLYRRNGSYAGLAREEIYPTFGNHEGYWGVDYPTQTITTPRAPYLLLCDDHQGLYTGCHDSTMQELVQFMLELKPGFADSFHTVYPTPEEAGVPVRLEYRVNHFPYANPGETVSLSQIAVAPYIGSWHKGLDIYKAWRRTWYVKPQTPAWVDDVHSWLQLHINSPEDELRCRYKDLRRYGEECARHGVRAIQLVGWNYGGQDRGNPAHDIDPRLGSWQELKDAIEYIQSLGVKIILFNKYTWSDRSTSWFKNELYEYAAKDPYGDYTVHPGYRYQTPTQLADINTRRLVPMCMMSAKWRDICCVEFEKSLSLGASGMLYDECQHHGGVQYCFAPTHGHHVPANVYAGDGKLADAFREIASEKAPEFLFAGEALYDREYRDYSLAYFRIDSSAHTPAERYIDPQANIMVAAVGFNDRGMLNACLRLRYIISYEPYMFKGSLEDFPKTVEYGKKIDALRRQYRQYLWDAEFRDTLGAVVTENDSPVGSYSVFSAADGKRALVVVNDKTIPITVKATFENDAFSKVLVTPEEPEPVPFDGVVTIPPRSAAVILEQR